jgi:DNA-directed RNA polymerase I, II, and III subunit RPABC3
MTSIPTEKSLTEVYLRNLIVVSRVTATSETRDMHLTLDVNTEIYPVKAGYKLTLLLASSLSNDPSVPDKETWRDNLNRKTIADDYEYVMYGKVYKFDDQGAAKWYA